MKILIMIFMSVLLGCAGIIHNAENRYKRIGMTEEELVQSVGSSPDNKINGWVLYYDSFCNTYGYGFIKGKVTNTYVTTDKECQMRQATAWQNAAYQINQYNQNMNQIHQNEMNNMYQQRQRQELLRLLQEHNDAIRGR